MNLKVNEDENQLAQSSNLFEPPGRMLDEYKASEIDLIEWW